MLRIHVLNLVGRELVHREVEANLCLGESGDTASQCLVTTAAIIEGAAPSIGVSLLMLCLPLLLRLTTTYAGAISHHHVERLVVIKFFAFLFINIFLVSALGGTLIDSIDTILENPRNIPSILGARLPARAKFFLSYILLDMLTYFPITLL